MDNTLNEGKEKSVFACAIKWVLREEAHQSAISFRVLRADVKTKGVSEKERMDALTQIYYFVYNIIVLLDFKVLSYNLSTYEYLQYIGN